MVVARVLVVRSARYQVRLVIVPVEWSVNVTVKGLTPVIGVALMPACGWKAPLPETVLVLPPPLAVANTTVLVKVAALVGVKPSSRLVAPKPGKLKGVPERMAKVPSLSESEAVPPRREAPPRF